MRKLLIIQVAGLGAEFVLRRRGGAFSGVPVRRLRPPFPAVTCTAQATFRTASPPSAHGMIGNGVYARAARRVGFWEQASSLVAGPRFWAAARARGARVAMLFWQQSLGEAVEGLLSPAPIHTHGGGLVEAMYAQPPDLEARLAAAVGRPFRLRQYWGPLASARSSDWIAAATAAWMRAPDAPELVLTYLPALDYDLQRFGPDHPRADRALRAVEAELGALAAAARAGGYGMVVFGDYAIETVGVAAFPNRALRRAGLLATRTVRGRRYADLHASRAFAVADHQVAHVYVGDPADLPAARAALRGEAGIGEVWDRARLPAAGLDHTNSGELVAVAAPGAWLAYPWREDDREAPDYAAHVDIHNKPGYDPAELFFGWPPGTVSRNAGRVRGSHGRVGGPETDAAWLTDIDLPGTAPETLADLAARVREWLL